MLIRDAQMAVFSRKMAEDFEKRLAAEVRAGFPAKTGELTDEDLLQVIHSGIEKANRFGIDQTFDVSRFVQLMFRFPSFAFYEAASTPWAKTILQDDSQLPAAKLDEIEGRGLIFGLLEDPRS